MNKYILIAGSRQLDTDNSGISLNYQISDIYDVTDRKDSFSQKFSLPGTPVNNLFFKQIFDVNVDNINFNPSIAIPATISVGDSEVFSGTLQLLNIVDNQGKVDYEVMVSGEFKTIMGLFGDDSLQSLNMTEFNHIRSRENIVKSWNYKIQRNGNEIVKGGPGYGYVYPYIVNGNSNDIWNRVEIYDLFPAPYIKTVIDKLFEYTNKTYSSKFFNSEYFSKLILPFTGDKLQLNEDEVNERKVRVGMSSEYFNLTDERNHDDGSWYYNSSQNYNLGLNKESGFQGDEELRDDLGQYTVGTFTSSKMGQYNVNFDGKMFPRVRKSTSGKIEYKSGNFEYVARLLLRRVGQGAIVIDDYKSDSNTDGKLTFGLSAGKHDSPWTDLNTPLQFSFSAQEIFLNPGDKIYVDLMYRRTGGVKFNGLNSSHHVRLVQKQSFDGESSNFRVSLSNNESMGNEMIKMNQLMPDMKMKEFFLSIADMFNLVIMDNPNKKDDLIIEPETDFFKTKKKVRDMTLKLDRSSDIKKTPLSHLDAETYLLTYDKDDDYYNKEYTDESKKIFGELKLDVQNDFSNKTKSTKLKFSPTVNAGQRIYDRVAPFFAEYDDGKIKPKKVKPRILFYGGPLYTNGLWINQNAAEDIMDGFHTNVYPYCGMWDHPTQPLHTLEFNNSDRIYWSSNNVPVNTLYEEFHKDKFNLITDPNSRLLEGMFHLTPSDIADFDFRDVWFIDGVYWRVNEIKDFNPVGSDSLTKVVLYKIIDYQENNPFSVEMPESNKGCPEDIVAVIGKGTGLSISSKHGGPYYKSMSGKIITPDCCKSIGGTIKDGICRPRTKIRPGTTVGRVDGVINVRPVMPISQPSGPISGTIDGNVIGRLGNIAVGKNIYINPAKDIKNTVVIGDGVSPTKSDSLQIKDMAYDESGLQKGDSKIGIDEKGNVKIVSETLDLDGVKDVKIGGLDISSTGVTYTSMYVDSGYVDPGYFKNKVSSAGFVYDEVTDSVTYKIDADKLDLEKVESIKLGNLNISETGNTFEVLYFDKDGYTEPGYLETKKAGVGFNYNYASGELVYNMLADYTVINNPVILTKNTPTSTLDNSGRVGEFRHDNNYIYIKTVNGWKRTTLEEF